MRLTAMAGVGVAILAFFIYLMSRMASPQMELLYADLELADANAIVTRLQHDKVPYELRREGAEIWVAKDRKLDMRVKMAEQALPSGGNLTGYELFDKSETLGSTSFMQNVNLVRALEGELARTIRSINGVKSARVHLVLPKREMFSRETQEPSASVVLSMAGSGRLGKQQVQAIQHMIAAAVPKLSPSRISIVDDKGTLLARGYESDQAMMSETAEERRLAYENRLNRAIEELLERTMGPSNVRVEVTAEMDFDRVATTEEVYDPEKSVIRSQVTIEEGENSSDSEGSPTTVTQNLPDVNAANSGNTRSSANSKRNQETVNYEVSKTVRNHVKELGQVRRLSVAVLVDGLYVDKDGNREYQPRTEQEMEQVASLVRSAVGYDANRGDQIEVVNLRFADGDEKPPAEADDKIFGFERDFVERIASNLGLSVVAILFLLLVLRPLVSRAVETMAAASERGLLTEGPGAPALAGPAPPTPGALLADESVDELIDIDKVEGRVKASSIRKIGEIVDKHPDEALSIIRSWMYQET